ncbi:MAG: PKD domain-containing protein [Bacteroidetes bacterium]|nr:PKD domain-containing protein [Bacteroidota bacterium]
MNRKPSFFRIDENVFITMGAFCLLSLMVLGFQYAGSEKCLPVNITFSDSLMAGNVVLFRADMPGAREFSWDFGDGISKDERTNTTTHIFKNPGQYEVTVLVNGACTQAQTIVVKEAPIVVNTGLLPIIISSDTLYTGVPSKFTDGSTTSTSWEWSFGETNSVDDTSQTATYSYSTPGYKKVYLRVNGRSDLTREKLVFVIDAAAERNKNINTPRPVPAPKPVTVRPEIKPDPSVEPIKDQAESNKSPVTSPVIQKAPDVSTDQLAAMIKSIAGGDKGADVFDPYLCKDKTVKVAYNGTVMPLAKFCEQLKELKSRKIKKISVWRNVNPETNCIESMVVTIESKKSIWPF